MTIRLEPLLKFLEKPSFETKPIADWMIDPWDHCCWRVKSALGKEVLTDAGWQNVKHRIYWDAALPRGLNLMDEECAPLLETIRRLFYLVRSGPQPFTQNANQHVSFGLATIHLLRFMVTHDLHRPISRLRFSSLTPHHFKIFLNLIPNGTHAAIGVEQHLRDFLSDLQNRNNLVPTFRSGSVSSLELSKCLGIPNTALLAFNNLERTLNEFGLFLDRNDSRAHDRLLPDFRSATRGHRDWASQSHVELHLSVWRELWKQREYLDDGLSFDPFDEVSAASMSKAVGKPKKRTPTMPYDTAIHYLNHSISWVEAYGDALVEYFESLLNTEKVVRNGRTSRHDYYAPLIFSMVEQPSVLAPLRITRYQAHPTNHTFDAQSELSAILAVRLLIAACIIAIGTFSARRIEELLALKLNPISGLSRKHMLSFMLEKGTEFGPLQQMSRPVPDIVEHACRLLERLNRLTEKQSEYLFSFPVKLGGALSHGTVQRLLDRFADHIDSPTLLADDGTTCRWYVRPHELRRFFAIAFFWHRSDANLDALSWFLGHLTREQTLHYIQESVAGKEISDLEAQYTVDALRRNRGNVENRDELTANISSHFKSDRLDLIPSSDLDAYVLHLYQTGALDIQIINAPTGLADDAILIRYSGSR